MSSILLYLFSGVWSVCTVQKLWEKNCWRCKFLILFKIEIQLSTFNLSFTFKYSNPDILSQCTIKHCSHLKLLLTENWKLFFLQNPEAMWMLEFTHCQECGKQRQQNNFCPLCDKCYSDDDFESKMVHCVKCDHWVHAECQGITVDQYECLTDLPEEVQFICRRCYEDQVSSPWYKELMEEMEAGYERVIIISR